LKNDRAQAFSAAKNQTENLFRHMKKRPEQTERFFVDFSRKAALR